MSSGKKIFGAFAISIALFFFWPAVVGGWQSIGALKAAVQERTDLLTKRTAVLANVQKEYAAYQQKVGAADGQKFAALVPIHKDTPEVLSALQAIATDAGVQLSEVRTTENKAGEAEQFRTLIFQMDITGSYPNMRQFLTSLESYVRLLNVQSMEIITDAQDPSRLRFTVRASAYFLK